MSLGLPVKLLKEAKSEGAKRLEFCIIGYVAKDGSYSSAGVYCCNCQGCIEAQIAALEIAIVRLRESIPGVVLH